MLYFNNFSLIIFLTRTYLSNTTWEFTALSLVYWRDATFYVRIGKESLVW